MKTPQLFSLIYEMKTNKAVWQMRPKTTFCI